MGQDLLFRLHIRDCPSCQKELVTVGEAKGFLIKEEETDVPENLWPAIRTGLAESEKKTRPLLRPGWKWAAVFTGLLVVIALGLSIFFGVFPDRESVDNSLVERFQIKYIRIEDKPATTYLYTLNESKIVFIWAEKNS